MYTVEGRVRYSETDEQGRLTVTGIMNYLQDCSTFQSEDIGQGFDHLSREKKAWWLHSWQILIDRQPEFGEKIRISTWPYGFKGIYGYRNFTITDMQGENLVRADSVWFFYDLEKNCPTRVPEKEIQGYGEQEERLLLPPAPKKIHLPEENRRAEPVFVQRHHLDTNQHVNNAQYAAIARELLPEHFSVRELRAEYKKAAMLGDRMIPKIANIPEGYVVSLQTAEGEVYANIWLAEKREDE